MDGGMEGCKRRIPLALPRRHPYACRAREGELQRYATRAFDAVSEFNDARPNRYQNPKLPFGGADIPEAGFSYRLVAPGADAPAGSRVKVEYRWRQ